MLFLIFPFLNIIKKSVHIYHLKISFFLRVKKKWLNIKTYIVETLMMMMMMMNRSRRLVVRSFRKFENASFKKTITTTTTTKRTMMLTSGATIGSILGGGAIVTAVAQGKDEDSSSNTSNDLLSRLMAEASGTFVLVAGGCGVVCAAKYANAAFTPFGIASIWGATVCLAVFATRDISGAHLNPAITATLAVNKPDTISYQDASMYMSAQTLGAGAAGYMNYLIFRNGISALEKTEGVTRGTAKSVSLLNGSFGMYPNQQLVRTGLCAFGVEVVATSIFSYLVFAITDENGSVPADAAPPLIGTTVAVLVSVFGGVTGCGMNPARDLGPRLASAAAGFGTAAMQSAWLYTAGPIVGAIIGGRIYMETIGKRLKEKKSRMIIS